MIWLIATLLSVYGVWHFFRTRQGFPVLMFHKIHPELQDTLTVSIPQFERQLQWLQDHNYQTITLEQLMRSLQDPKSLPDRSVLITFDDAYVNNLTHALPILQRFGMNAVLFVPTAFTGGCNEWDGCTEPLMTTDQLRQLLPTFELALHSHRHLNYKHQTAAVIEEDLTENITAFDALNLPYIRAFAYPYGGRPKDAATKQAMQRAMQQLGIGLAFRIGNRLNRFPANNRYELQRLDIRGTDSLTQFARKIRFGKLI